MIASLLDMALVEEGPSVPRKEIGYRLTDKGWLAHDRCIGGRPLGASAT